MPKEEGIRLVMMSLEGKTLEKSSVDSEGKNSWRKKKKRIRIVGEGPSRAGHQVGLRGLKFILRFIGCVK